MTPFLVGLVIVIVAMAQATKTIGPISDPEPRGGVRLRIGALVSALR